jgi:hypothetical protein
VGVCFSQWLNGEHGWEQRVVHPLYCSKFSAGDTRDTIRYTRKCSRVVYVTAMLASFYCTGFTVNSEAFITVRTLRCASLCLSTGYGRFTVRTHSSRI